VSGFDFFSYLHRLIDDGIWALLSPSQKAVLLVILRHLNSDTHQAWPSLARLSHLSGISRWRVQRAIAGLVAAGFVKKAGIKISQGTRRKLVFTVMTLPEDTTAIKSHIVAYRKAPTNKSRSVAYSRPSGCGRARNVASLSSYKPCENAATKCGLEHLIEHHEQLRPLGPPIAAPAALEGAGAAGGTELSEGEEGNGKPAPPASDHGTTAAAVRRFISCLTEKERAKERPAPRPLRAVYKGPPGGTGEKSFEMLRAALEEKE
jgi:hypothetical protein